MKTKTLKQRSTNKKRKITILLFLCLFSSTIVADNYAPQISPDIINYIGNYAEPARPAIESAGDGEIVISCNITEKGEVTNATIKYRVLEQLDNEALSLVRNMPPWGSASINGKKVKVSAQIGVKFFPTRVRIVSWNEIASQSTNPSNSSYNKISNSAASSNNSQKNYFEKEKKYIVSSKSKLNIRDSYSQQSNIIGKLNPGEPVVVYGIVNNWAIIKHGGNDAYIISL